MAHHQVLVIGGGTAGLAVSALLCNQPNPPEVAIVEPSSKHYYQPIWTLVGAGEFPADISERDEADYIPLGATWIQDYVETIDAENNSVTLRGGDVVTYDYLVVAAGIQIDWDKIPGLQESVGKPGSGVVSNYAFEQAPMTWEALKNTKGGNALFTHPSTPIKCGGAPLKITYLAHHYWQRQGRRDKFNMDFLKGAGGIFPVPKYAVKMTEYCNVRDIGINFWMDLVELRPDSQEAVFKQMETGEMISKPYDFIHVTPPMSAPDFLKKSTLGNEGGWVDVNKHTTQHVRYPNVFSIGDASSLPTSKTGAAIRKQAPTLVANLTAVMHNNPMPKSYNGYTSCPLITGYGSLMLMEFDYDKTPTESFPFNQAEERYSMYALKAYALPQMYWHGMLRGREF